MQYQFTAALSPAARAKQYSDFCFECQAEDQDRSNQLPTCTDNRDACVPHIVSVATCTSAQETRDTFPAGISHSVVREMNESVAPSETSYSSTAQKAFLENWLPRSSIKSVIRDLALLLCHLKQARRNNHCPTRGPVHHHHSQPPSVEQLSRQAPEQGNKAKVTVDWNAVEPQHCRVVVKIAFGPAFPLSTLSSPWDAGRTR